MPVDSRRFLLPFLLAAALLPTAASADTRIAVGKTVQGQLLATDRPSDNGGRSHDYLVPLNEGQLVAISARSQDFDAVVILFKPDGDLLAENDDRDGGGTDPLLVTTVPSTGLYRVRVNSLPVGEGHTGSYSLRVNVVSDDH